MSMLAHGVSKYILRGVLHMLNLMNQKVTTNAMELFNEYVQTMDIDFFAFPVQYSGNVKIALVNPVTVREMIANHELPVEFRKGESFARLRRLYTATKVLRVYHTPYVFDTGLSTVKAIPCHKGMPARGWEIVVADTLDGKHTGDNIHEVDVIHPIYGRIECKIGGGRFYTAAAATEE
jgi:hypothetical protein